MDYLYRFPQLLRETDSQQVKSRIKNIGKSIIASIIVGAILNVNLKSIYPQILDKPLPLRWSARLALMGLPVALVYQFYGIPQRAKLNEYLAQMHTRMILLG